MAAPPDHRRDPQRLYGGDALSGFRRDRLLAEAALQAAGVAGARARHLYLLEIDGELPDDHRDRLLHLLEARDGGPAGGSEPDLVVFPRPGTISPWSSKAGDILRNCGLKTVRRVERATTWWMELHEGAEPDRALRALSAHVHDRMTQVARPSIADTASLFHRAAPVALATIPVLAGGPESLARANASLGLALSEAEIAYLVHSYAALGRDPTDVELMMFAQANSEHCRHKIFNATWEIDGERPEKSLFGMIRHTHACHPGRILSAYSDNAAVVEGPVGAWFHPEPGGSRYRRTEAPVDILMKVETHNHPTAISPYPGAATGSGGEIRDEAAVGRGGRTKAGLAGFSVSNLRIPGFVQPWETDHGRPGRIASALQIMLEGPIGAAAFNNEFGRPGLYGYFRTLEATVPGPDGPEHIGYHKPIMVAGGMGNIRREQVDKAGLPEGTAVVVLGGPAMLIGLGGGAASSVASGSGEEDLDFASVQRENPEMQRRCQEVIDRCWHLGDENPVLSIHDVGAGGLSNAVPEIVEGAGRGGRLELRQVPSADPGMSPMEIWCNESQERYVLAVAADGLDRFRALCARERCPHAVLGEVTAERRLRVADREFGDHAVDLDLEVLFGNPPAMHRTAARRRRTPPAPDTAALDLPEAVNRVLCLPAVADKTFLVTIGDRTVTGMVARDPMVGPWQVPVADCAVTLSDYDGHTGEAMAMGERAPVAVVDAPASGRMAVGEAVTNIAAADIEDLGRVVLSANWMAACGDPGEDADLHDTVRAVAMELCPALGVAIPVGKDSLSMKTVWEHEGERRCVSAPLSLVVSAFAPVADVRACLTPQLRLDAGDTDLWLVDLGAGRNRLGGSALAQVTGRLGGPVADLDDPARLRGLFDAVRALRAEGALLAYHDRSDGGLLATLCEMAFAGGAGLEVDLSGLGPDAVAALFTEELGAVVQARAGDAHRLEEIGARWPALEGLVHRLGSVRPGAGVRITAGPRVLVDAPREALRGRWSETTRRMQGLRDDPGCAEEEHETRVRPGAGGLFASLSFDPSSNPAAPAIAGARPRVAILREQGVNGHVEMAAAFDRAGFESVDVHMSDLLEGESTLDGFRGLAACGGFSYGDVLGAGGGWAGSLRYNDRSREAFEAFVEREDCFVLGVCNGCQMVARLAPLIRGAADWPRFVRNRSEQFEGRLVLTEVLASPSVLLSGMAGSVLPTVVAHGEGRATFTGEGQRRALEDAGLVCLRYVDPDGAPAARYPENPNGSPGGITGVTTADGRITVMMPHPERLFRAVQHSWHPAGWGEDGPWLRMFRNARAWVG